MNTISLKTPFGRLRAIGFLEGISFIVLLFIAMPMKYFLDMPDAVRVVGMAHGVLFVLYVVILVMTGIELRWPFWKYPVGLLASILPFGPFFLHRWLSDKKDPGSANP